MRLLHPVLAVAAALSLPHTPLGAMPQPVEPAPSAVPASPRESASHEAALPSPETRTAPLPAGEAPVSQSQPGIQHGSEHQHSPDTQGFRVRLPSQAQIATRMMVRKLMLDLYDRDRNHELDQNERRALLNDAERTKRDYAMKLAQRFDADQDGELSPEETAALQNYVRERQQSNRALELIRQAPEGSLCMIPLPPPPGCKPSPEDGVLEAPKPDREHLTREGRLVALIVGHLTLAAYDSNEDGFLDEQESRQLCEDGKWLYAMREKALLEAHDRNRDGRIDRQELRAALEERFSADGDEQKRKQRRSQKTTLDRMLDTHFDVDILLHLSQKSIPNPLP